MKTIYSLNLIPVSSSNIEIAVNIPKTKCYKHHSVCISITSGPIFTN